jgi:hypothetical protein
VCGFQGWALSRPCLSYLTFGFPSQMVFDVLVLSLTGWNACARPRNQQTALTQAMNRDGIVFFLVSAAADSFELEYFSMLTFDPSPDSCWYVTLYHVGDLFQLLTHSCRPSQCEFVLGHVYTVLPHRRLVSAARTNQTALSSCFNLQCRLATFMHHSKPAHIPHAKRRG